MHVPQEPIDAPQMTSDVAEALALAKALIAKVHPRKESKSPTFELPTPFGPILLRPNGADTVYLYTSVESNRPFLTVNRVPVKVSLNAMRQEDGRWTLKTTGYDIRRADAGDLSSNARSKVQDELTTLVNDWAATHAAELARAEAVRLSEAARRLEHTAQDQSKELVETLHTLVRVRADYERAVAQIPSPPATTATEA